MFASQNIRMPTTVFLNFYLPLKIFSDCLFKYADTSISDVDRPTLLPIYFVQLPVRYFLWFSVAETSFANMLLIVVISTQVHRDLVCEGVVAMV